MIVPQFLIKVRFIVLVKFVVVGLIRLIDFD